MTEIQAIVVWSLIVTVGFIQLLVDIDYIATRMYLRRTNKELDAALQAIKKPQSEDRG